jgi:hypothetical protein
MHGKDVIRPTSCFDDDIIHLGPLARPWAHAISLAGWGMPRNSKHAANPKLLLPALSVDKLLPKLYSVTLNPAHNSCCSYTSRKDAGASNRAGPSEPRAACQQIHPVPAKTHTHHAFTPAQTQTRANWLYQSWHTYQKIELGCLHAMSLATRLHATRARFIAAGVRKCPATSPSRPSP